MYENPSKIQKSMFPNTLYEKARKSKKNANNYFKELMKVKLFKQIPMLRNVALIMKLGPPEGRSMAHGAP